MVIQYGTIAAISVAKFYQRQSNSTNHWIGAVKFKVIRS